MNKKVAVISLGCDKNRVDTENMLYYLSQGGYEIVYEPTQAEVIIINTCAFIAMAEKEALDTIFDAQKLRSNGILKKIVVTGCLTARYKEKLTELLPEVDVFMGINDYSKICEAIEGTQKLYIKGEDDATTKRVLSSPPHFAYLKIAEGCDNHCTYCTIPSLRGKYRSRTIESLIEEAKSLDDLAVSELIIVAQDVTNYGKDIYGSQKLVELLKNILKECNFVRIRLLYCYPELVTDELIELIATQPRIAKYIDVPLQHVSDTVLKRMGRKSTKAQIISLFNKLKSRGITIRTTFMVGFPGETEDEFNELCDFVKEYKPENVGIFAYSKENGTPAARMTNQVLKSVKAKRVDTLGALSALNTVERNKAMIGKTVDVIYENIDYDRNMFIGRTEQNAPEIDSVVYFSGKFCEVGKIYKVKITAYDGYDLIGEAE